MSKYPVRKATFRALVNEVLTDIYATTSTDNIVINSEGELLSDYLERLVTQENMEEALQQLKEEIIDEAPEIFDTLKEIAEWIKEHGDFVQYLEELVNSKADKTEVDALAEALTALSNAFTESAKIYYSDVQPTALKSGDMWVQPVVDASVLDDLQPT